MKGKMRYKNESDCVFWTKDFEIATICREDLIDDFGKNAVQSLSDADMISIALKIADTCDIETVVQKHLNYKK